MAEQPASHRLIVRLQFFWQFVLLGWFALVTALLLLKSDWAPKLALIGVGLIVAATVSIVAGLAWQFERAGQRGRVALCGVLLVLLALAVTIRYIAL